MCTKGKGLVIGANKIYSQIKTKSGPADDNGAVLCLFFVVFVESNKARYVHCRAARRPVTIALRSDAQPQIHVLSWAFKVFRPHALLGLTRVV